MGFLNPLMLLAAAAVAVPLILHLFQRHESRRVAFPALRYLQRTEKEHARRIRFRQILLLLIRVAVILLLVAAASRLFLRGSGSAHDPTALAIVLDNSMSSGLVEGDARTLDRLKALALETLDSATPDDRIWVLRAGEPWDVAVPGSPSRAAERVRRTEVSQAAGDLSAAVARAATLVRETDLPAREIHLLSDLQASGFAGTPPEELEGIPLVVFRSTGEPPPNRWLAGAEVGGGLPPLAGQRTEVAVPVGRSGEGGPDDSVRVRLVLDDRVSAAATVTPGATAVLPMGPFPAGRVTGWVETDPDALGADDRRWFAFEVRPPPAVAVVGESPFFLSQGLEVLRESGRARTSPPAGAGILLAMAGAGLEDRGDGASVVVLPPADPSVLPALNRRLAAAGIPWSYEAASGQGEVAIWESRIPVELDEVRIYGHYRLRASPDVPPSGEIVVRLAGGDPWLITGRAPGGPWLLLASPLEPEATNLPVSAAMVPLLEWMLGRWGVASGGAPDLPTGEPLATASAAERVRAPDGTLHAVDGTQLLRRTREAGIYTVFGGDSILDQVAVNVPVRESDLTRLEPEALDDRTGADLRLVEDPADWVESVFASRQGPELWRPLLLAVLVLLLVESWIAAAGREARTRRSPVREGSPTRGTNP